MPDFVMMPQMEQISLSLISVRVGALYWVSNISHQQCVQIA